MMGYGLNLHMAGYKKNDKWIGELTRVVKINDTPGVNRQIIEDIKCVPLILFEYTPGLETLVLSLTEEDSGKMESQRNRNKLAYLYQKISDYWSEFFDERKSTKGHNNLSKMYSEELVAILKITPEDKKYCSTFKVSFVINDYVKDRDRRKCFENPPELFKIEYCLDNNKKRK